MPWTKVTNESGLVIEVRTGRDETPNMHRSGDYAYVQRARQRVPAQPTGSFPGLTDAELAQARVDYRAAGLGTEKPTGVRRQLARVMRPLATLLATVR